MTSWDYQTLLNEAKAASAWPAGDYDMQIVECDATVTSTGKDALTIKLRALNGPYMGKHVSRMLSISTDSPVALDIFFRVIRGFGLTDEYLVSLDQQGDAKLQMLAQVLMGRTGRVSLVQKPFNGRMQNDIGNVAPLAPGTAGTVPVGVVPQTAAPAPLPTPAAAPPPPPVAAPAPAAVPQAAPPVAPPPPPPAAPPATPPPPAAPPAAPAQVPGQATQEAAAYVATADQPAVAADPAAAQWAQFQAWQAQQAAAQQAAPPVAPPAPPAPVAAPAPAAAPIPVPAPPPPPAPPGMPV